MMDRGQQGDRGNSKKPAWNYKKFRPLIYLETSAWGGGKKRTGEETGLRKRERLRGGASGLEKEKIRKKKNTKGRQ